MEGYTQRTERTHEYLIDLRNIRHNQIIWARISDQSSLLATDTDGEHVQAKTSLGASRAAASTTTLDHSFATLLTFFDSALVGGNYDTSAESDFADAAPGIDTVFQDVLENTQQRKIPTLNRVAQKVAHQEGINLVRQQYIAYTIIVCSFLLCLTEDTEFNCTSALHNMEASQRDTLIQ